MRRTILISLLGLALFTCFSAQPAQAGLKDFFDKLLKQLDELNNNMSKVGENWSKNFQEGGFSGALKGAAADLDAANNANEEYRLATIAAFKQLLKDFICFIPRTIKKVWDAFVDFLTWLRDILFGSGGDDSTGDTDTTTKASSTLGAEGTEPPASVFADGFVERFRNEADISKRLEHFLAQACACDEMARKLAPIEEGEAKDALTEKLTLIQNETALLEGIVKDELRMGIFAGDSAAVETLVDRAEALPQADRRPFDSLLRASREFLNARTLEEGTPQDEKLVSRIRDLLE